MTDLERLRAKTVARFGPRNPTTTPAPIMPKRQNKVVMPLPCLHLGKPVAPPEGKQRTKAWHVCEEPSMPLGVTVVCSCIGCGVRCKGYVPDDTTAPLPEQTSAKELPQTDAATGASNKAESPADGVVVQGPTSDSSALPVTGTAGRDSDSPVLPSGVLNADGGSPLAHGILSSAEPRRMLYDAVAELKWAYGVTTVPGRRHGVLERTLASLAAAGFDRPHLFVDGDFEMPSWLSEYRNSLTMRYQKVGAFGNWMLALLELYIRQPDAHRYAVFQDDFVTYKNLRQFLDKCQFPHAPDRKQRQGKFKQLTGKGYWNLYTFPGYTQQVKSNGWFETIQRGKGAVALVFDREQVLALLAAEGMLTHPMEGERGKKGIDGRIVTVLNKLGYGEYAHFPTLTMHIGVESAIGNPPHPAGANFMGENFDALELLK